MDDEHTISGENIWQSRYEDVSAGPPVVNLWSGDLELATGFCARAAGIASAD